MLTLRKFQQKYGKIICDSHNDKMSDLYSISTSPLCNAECEKRSKIKDCICSHCYSENMNKRFKGLREKLIRNTELLTTVIIPAEDMPILYSPTNYFRFEAFGDLINEIQVVNYFNFAKYNPTVNFALWTKNPWIIDKAIKAYGVEKPENLVIIGSSYMINQVMEYKQYGFIDYTFTVYTRDYAAENNIAIVCGGNSCADCGKCYIKNHTNRNITELLK